MSVAVAVTVVASTSSETFATNDDTVADETVTVDNINQDRDDDETCIAEEEDDGGNDDDDEDFCDVDDLYEPDCECDDTCPTVRAPSPPTQHKGVYKIKFNITGSITWKKLTLPTLD
ncbi:hypothetical protein ElyMa_004848500 [Elysia marginata]|uniref:Uncharacterized protein n=1 Tax=Elysia marginata TaxID=1093978 RepID=A0AAV4IPA9_9GAST|nr:hypothetical protein ElyMa_004848500 [Elysia marginata]